MRAHAAWFSVAFSVALPACGNSVASSATPAHANADAGPDFLTLAPGEVAEVTVTTDRAAARLATPSGSEQFVAIVASTKLDSSSGSFAYSVSTDPVDVPSASQITSGCALSSDAFRTASVAVDPEPAGAAPQIGTTRSRQVSVGTKSETITAEVMAVSARAIVWKDTSTAHPATLDAAFVADFLADFDTTILPRERSVFGMESDIDGDGRIGLVFTPLTKESAVAFFLGCDLAHLDGCPSGNKGEFLYLTPPADIAPPYNTPAAIKEILAHDLGHLVHFNRKVVRNNLQVWADSSYMIEGFGGFAQDVIGFQAGNFYVAQAGLNDIDAFSLADVLGNATKYDKKRDGPLRGGAYLFVRYIYDRAGGDNALTDGTIEGRGGSAFLRKVLDDRKSVAAAMPLMGPSTLADLALDFYTALAMSNGEKGGHASPVNACFSYMPTQSDPITGKQRGADLYASFHGQQMQGPTIQNSADGTIRGGGVEYVKLAARAGQKELDVTITTASEASVRVRIARVR